MGCKPRIHYPGVFYHVINRGNQRCKLFWDNDDYQRMLERLEYASTRYQLRVHAYCLMPNHFHLLAEVGEHPLEAAMKSAETAFAQHSNRRHGKTGHVFQSRYRAVLCDKPSYLLELMRYIHLNPVRAGLVSCPEDWAWSSHRTYLGLAKTPWLCQQEVMDWFGQQGQSQLTEFLGQAQDLSPHPEYYRPERFPLLGPEDFLSHLPPGQEPGREREPGYPGPRMSLEAIADAVAQAEGFSGTDLKGRGGGYRISRLRDEMVYAALHFFFYPSVKVANFLRLTPSAVTHSHQRMQERLRQAPQQAIQMKRLLRGQ